MPTAVSFLVCVMMIGPLTRFSSMTARKKPFLFVAVPESA